RDLRSGFCRTFRHLAAADAVRLERHATSLDDHQRVAELDRLAIPDPNLDDRPRARGGDLGYWLYRLAEEERVAGLHAAANFDEGFGARLGSDISGADHGRSDHAWMLGGIERRGLARG